MNYWTGLMRRLRGRDKAWWDYFLVEFDDAQFTVTERRIFGSDCTRQGRWDDVGALCFKDGGLGSDTFLVFLTADASDSPFMVPVEAQGGQAFWDEVKRRGLFPAEISGQAVRSASTGSELWWPHRP